MCNTAPDAVLEQLMADSRLVQLCEFQRTGDEILDVISLTENQHSDVLAWMLDAREGHGQGDEILRDLLVSASTVAASGFSGLDGRGTTARFFAQWPPSRIRTTSFGAAFTARELGIKAKERVDLFVIDPQNKVILVVENKAGAMHYEDQLDVYRDSFGTLVADNPGLRDYHHVFIALDREFDGEDCDQRPCANYWLHLGYDWLKISATRALMHVSRGNSAAKLVVSYCNRQTDWENSDIDKCMELAAALHQVYPEAVKQLLRFSGGRLEREWLTQVKSDAVLLFLLQNKGAIGLLKETQGMATVRSAILAKLTSLPKESVAHKRAWLDMCPNGWEQFEGNSWWPVFLNVRYADDAKSKYTLALCWNADLARSDPEARELRQRLIQVDSRFSQHADSRWRRVVTDRAVGLAELLKRVADLDSQLKSALSVAQTS